MKTFLVLWQKELLEQVRTRRLLVIGSVFLFFAVSSPILAKLMPEIFKHVATPGITINIATPTYKDAMDQFMKNVGQLGLFILIFVVAGAIADEKTNGTLELILAKPVRRNTYVSAAFLGYITTTALLFLAAAAVFYGYTVSLFGNFNTARFLMVVAVTLLYILTAVSITLLGSTLAKNSLGAAGIGFLALILLSILPLVAPDATPYLPGYAMEKYSAILQEGWKAEYWKSAGVALALILGSLFTATSVFRQQEIERKG